MLEFFFPGNVKQHEGSLTDSIKVNSVCGAIGVVGLWIIFVFCSYDGQMEMQTQM